MFSKTAQYAFKILIFMQQDGKDLFSASYIHEATNIPYKYLTMLMTKLSKNGLLNASRGRYGGFSLARESELISLTDILDAIGENRLEQCMIDDCFTCEERGDCAIHQHWQAPKNKMIEMLNNTKISVFNDVEQINALEMA